jgi:hypothetical protein
MWMGMPDADHGMTSIKIQVLNALIVPYIRTSCFDDVDIVYGIYVE